MKATVKPKKIKPTIKSKLGFQLSTIILGTKAFKKDISAEAKYKPPKAKAKNPSKKTTPFTPNISIIK